jgi:hypothetical protein
VLSPLHYLWEKGGRGLGMAGCACGAANAAVFAEMHFRRHRRGSCAAGQAAPHFERSSPSHTLKSSRVGMHLGLAPAHSHSDHCEQLVSGQHCARACMIGSAHSVTCLQSACCAHCSRPALCLPAALSGRVQAGTPKLYTVSIARKHTRRTHHAAHCGGSGAVSLSAVAHRTAPRVHACCLRAVLACLCCR